MIVYGSVSIVQLFVEFFQKVSAASKKDDDESCSKGGSGCLNFVAGSLNMFKFIWTIIFAVYLYQSFKPNYEDER